MRKHLEIKALTLLLIFVIDIFKSPFLIAGSGPSQPEMAAFTPAGTTELVDPFTGDFSYNIPLLDIEGYPVNIAYNSGVGMEQEASWVGLGWSLNVGAISRSVRGIPDDFNGESISSTTSMKKMTITKVGLGGGLEALGAEELLSASGGVSFIYNNYQGLGLAIDNSIGVSTPPAGGVSANAKVGFTLSSLDGASTNTSLGLKYSRQVGPGTMSIGGQFGSGFSTRTGQTTRSFGTTAGYSLNQYKEVGKDGKVNTVTTKENNSVGSISSSATFLPIGVESYTPYSSMRMKTTKYAFSGSIGGEAWGLNPNGRLNGSQTIQEVANQNQSTPSYGYLYSENARLQDIKDFNREKEVELNSTVNNLSPTQFTYDVYSVKGQGVSGSFRPFRNDIGILNDPSYSITASASDNFGGELGFGGYMHGGLSYSTLDDSRSYGTWVNGNNAGIQSFEPSSKDLKFENYYFKAAGDKTQINSKYFESLGGFEAVEFKLDGANLTNQIISSDNKQRTGLPSPPRKRKPRSKVFMTLTAEEAAIVAHDKYKSTEGSFYKGSFQEDTFPRVDGGIREAHHISQITQTNPDGESFVFGIPAYNRHKEEVSYATNYTSTNGIVPYSSDEASTSNSAGVDNFYNSISTPPYAHSYLLSAKLSPDYHDITGNGVSSDDPGNAYEFSYTKTSDNYNWRSPYSGSTYSKGFESNDLDQKASFTYGTKELWYLHTIQSKNQVAEFYISKRKDAVGVIGRAGGIGTNSNANSTYRLDSIRLYNKVDRMINKENAIPLKRVIFDYDYSLCDGIPSNIDGGGKLTLLSITTLNGNENIGKLSPYVFHYDENPDYNANSMDRWGSYQEASHNPLGLGNDIFPYSNQSISVSKSIDWASAWNLSRIELPKGGVIEVAYEQDDYAYVQDRKAMQMYPIVGAGKNTSVDSASISQLYDNTYLYFRRPKGLSSTASSTEVSNKLFGSASTDKLYFKVKTNIRRNKYEYVSGYINASGAGICSNDVNYCYIKLNGQSPNPVSKASWGYFRHNLFNVLYEQPNINDNGLESILKGMKAALGEVAQMFSGVESKLKENNVANYFKWKESFLRLNNVNGHKRGGGSRVSKIILNDRWNDMSGKGENAIYGQTYHYLTTNENNDTISSGVASYEPMIGNDENPFREPDPYVVVGSSGHIPAITAYQEKPYGESFFPGASVGYSNVEVRDVNFQKGKTSNRITEHKFYTAKEFPVIVKSTSLEPYDNPDTRTPFSFPFSNQKRTSVFAASQGFSIILNDMHGKPRSSIDYGLRLDTLNGLPTITKKKNSGTIYHYNVTPEGENYRVRNGATMLTNEGKVKFDSLGIDFDIAIDSRESRYTTQSNSSQLNVDIIPTPFFGAPVAIPIPLANFLTQEKITKSLTITKVIQQYGLIDYVEQVTDQYSTSKRNITYDGRTGEVLLTQNTNEYGKELFNYTIPSHSVKGQDRMGAAYKNSGYSFSPIPDDNSDCNPNDDSYYGTSAVHGDEVLIKTEKTLETNARKGWIKMIHEYDRPSIVEPCTDSIYDRMFTMWHQGDFANNLIRYEDTTIKGYRGQLLEKAIIYPLKDHFQQSYSIVINNLKKHRTSDWIFSPKGYLRPSTAFSHYCNPPFSFDTQTNQFETGYWYDIVRNVEGRNWTTFASGALPPNDTTIRWPKGLQCSNCWSGPPRVQSGLVTLDLSGEVNDIPAAYFDLIFDFNSPINASLESSIVMDNRSDTTITVEYNACIETDDMRDGFLDYFYEPLYGRYNTAYVNGIYPGYYNPIKDPYEFKSQTFFRIEKNSELSTLLSQEQLYLIKHYYLDSDQKLDSAYYVERGRGHNDYTLPDELRIKNCEFDYLPYDYEVWENMYLMPTIYNTSLAYCPSTYQVLDREGNPITGLNEDDELKVIRSGNRNMLSESNGVINSSKNPIKTDANNDNAYAGIESDLNAINFYQIGGANYLDSLPPDNSYSFTANEFIRGNTGKFHVDSTYSFIGSRYQKNSIELSIDGYYEQLPSLWVWDECKKLNDDPPFTLTGGSSSGWNFLNAITSSSSNGSPQEVVNNLGLYTSKVIDHANSVKVVASNSKRNSIAFDDFEEYTYLQSDGILNDNRFMVIKDAAINDTDQTILLNSHSEDYRLISFPDLKEVVTGIGHTGNASLFLKGSNPYITEDITVSSSYALNDPLLNYSVGDTLSTASDSITFDYDSLVSAYSNSFLLDKSPSLLTQINAVDSTYHTIQLGPTIKNGNFTPDSGVYTISVWVKEMVSPSSPFSGISPFIEIIDSSGSRQINIKSQSIDGWYKLEGNFTYNSNINLQIRLHGGNWGTFYDDLRIHPYQSNINSYVYDVRSRRLIAKLDENNFATFYKYDPSGVPSQIQRETTNGRITISESRQSLHKKTIN